MKTLTIRGLPDDVHARLKARAKKNRRSLNQEVIAELAADVPLDEMSEEEQKRLRAERLIARAREINRRIEHPLTADEIRTAINEGRK